MLLKEVPFNTGIATILSVRLRAILTAPLLLTRVVVILGFGVLIRHMIKDPARSWPTSNWN